MKNTKVLLVDFSQKISASQKTDCAVQVVGFGIAGLGIALAADRHHYLSALCEQGLVYIDKRAPNTFDSLHFDILSNSPADDFIGGIRRDGAFASMFDNANGKKLCCLSDKEAPLTLVSDFFGDTAKYLNQTFEHYQRSQFIANTEVTALRLEGNGDITSLDAHGKPLVRSQFAVVATGSEESPKAALIDLATRIDVPLVCSETILRGECDAQLLESIRAEERIVVIGGAHSAFSVVDYILRRFGHHLDNEQVLILSRSPINIYYDSIEQFNTNAQIDEAYRVDFETQRINRYCGLRCDAKKRYQKIMAGDEPRVQLIITPEDSAFSALDQLSTPVGLIVQAIGYTAKQPRLVDCQDNDIACQQTNACAALSKNYNFKTNNNQTLERVFGIGLGCFIPTLSPYSTTGEVPVGVNVYHQKDAAAIVDHIINYLASDSAAPAISNNEPELSDLC